MLHVVAILLWRLGDFMYVRMYEYVHIQIVIYFSRHTKLASTTLNETILCTRWAMPYIMHKTTITITSEIHIQITKHARPFHINLYCVATMYENCHNIERGRIIKNSISEDCLWRSLAPKVIQRTYSGLFTAQDWDAYVILFETGLLSSSYWAH